MTGRESTMPTERNYPPDGSVVAARRFTYVNRAGGTYSSDESYADEQYAPTARLRIDRQWDDQETGRHFACTAVDEDLRAFLDRNAHADNKTAYISEFDLVSPETVADAAARAVASRVGELLLSRPGAEASLPAMIGVFLREHADDFMAEQMHGVEDEEERDAVRGLLALVSDALDPDGAAGTAATS